MHGAAVTLAEQFMKLNIEYDLIIAGDMIDLALFKSLIKTPVKTKFVLYFHENQLAYPWSPDDADVSFQRDAHYAFINYSSALCADFCFFNSNYHKNIFLKSLRVFLAGFPDYNNLDTVDKIERKSSVLYLGCDLKKFDCIENNANYNGILRILWNHRWEYDKNPDAFYDFLAAIKTENVDFRLILTGEKFKKVPPVLNKIRNDFSDRIIFDGFAESQEEYARLLKSAHLLPVTNIQDFFGISILEAVYCGAVPLLPERLSYTEIFDNNQNGEFFYASMDEMIEKTVRISLNFNDYKTNSVKYCADKFDWSNMIQVYEDAFNSAISGNE